MSAAAAWLLALALRAGPAPADAPDAGSAAPPRPALSREDQEVVDDLELLEQLDAVRDLDLALELDAPEDGTPPRRP